MYKLPARGCTALRIGTAAWKLRSCFRPFIVAGILAAWVAAAFLAGESRAQTGNFEPSVSEAYLDINDVRARIFDDGNLFWRGDPVVYEVPRNEAVNAVFTTVFWVGG